MVSSQSNVSLCRLFLPFKLEIATKESTINGKKSYSLQCASCVTWNVDMSAGNAHLARFDSSCCARTSVRAASMPYKLHLCISDSDSLIRHQFVALCERNKNQIRRRSTKMDRSTNVLNGPVHAKPNAVGSTVLPFSRSDERGRPSGADNGAYGRVACGKNDRRARANCEDSLYNCHVFIK